MYFIAKPATPASLPTPPISPISPTSLPPLPLVSATACARACYNPPSHGGESNPLAYSEPRPPVRGRNDHARSTAPSTKPCVSFDHNWRTHDCGKLGARVRLNTDISWARVRLNLDIEFKQNLHNDQFYST